MLDWLGDEGDDLAQAFRRVFGRNHRPFGSRALHVGGLSDGNEGVQWNAAYDPRDDRRWVGVNLEGLKYSDWPVARLISRELREPTLVRFAEDSAEAGPTEVLWARDYWQVASRPRILEGHIAPTPIRLGQLTEPAWREALTGAAACLEPVGSGWKRAEQDITLAASERRVAGPVSPHLTLIYRAVGKMPWGAFLLQAKRYMQRYYEWAVTRSA